MAATLELEGEEMQARPCFLRKVPFQIGKDGKSIPGLYAVGEATRSVHGRSRVGSNAVPDALVFWRIAGQLVSAAKAIGLATELCRG